MIALLTRWREMPALPTAFLALLVYGFTLAPGLTWANYGGDGGELITAAATLGVPHPSGYPTYVLLGKLISLLPIGEVAWRFNLWSAVCMAGAAGMVAGTSQQLWAQHLGKKDKQTSYYAICAGLTFAFSPLVWGQSVITELYALNMLLVAGLMWSAVRGVPAFFVGIGQGLAITTHLTSLFLLPLGFYLRGRQQIGGWLLGLALGLTPFLAIPLLATGNSPVIWGEPTTLAGWWWLVSGKIYQPNLWQADMGGRLGEWLLGLGWQFAGVGWFFWLWGMFSRPFRQWGLWMATVTFYGVHALGYGTTDAHILFIPALWLLSVWLIFGLEILRKWAFVLPLLLVALNFSTQNLNNERQTEELAYQALATVPAQAIVITPGDSTIFSLWYLQHVQGFRPDLILIDNNLFAFDWYRQRLSQHYPDLTHLEQDDLPALIIHTHRPVCYRQLATSGKELCE